MQAAASASRRLRLVVAPVCLAGIGTFAAAVAVFATGSHSVSLLAGMGALMAAMILAERFPVPLDGIDASGVHLAFVFGVSAVVLFGWAAGVVAVFAAPAWRPGSARLRSRRSAARTWAQSSRRSGSARSPSTP